MIEIEAPTFPTIPAAANDNGWFIVRTNPRCERRVIFGLRDQKIVSYLPCEIRWKRTRLSKTRVKIPLFTGYLFVGLRTNDAGAPEKLYEVKATDGVAEVVGICGAPAEIKGDWVAKLMQREAGGDFDHTPAERLPFSPGQMVKIVRGKFQGVMAEVVATADNDQVRVTATGIFAGTWPVDADHIEVA